MKRRMTGLLLAALLMLGGCAETELASYVWKSSYPPPPNQGTFKVGNPYMVQGTRYVPAESYNFSETGIASWYGPGFDGKRTANGEVFNKRELTAAHKTLQMPSLIRVTNLDNGRSLIVRVNDRGPYSRGRVLDMSERAAELLGFKGRGTAKVRIDLLPEESRRVAELAKQGQDTRGFEVALNQNRLPVGSPPPQEVVLAQQTTTYPAQPPAIPPGAREQIGSVSVHEGAGGVLYPDQVVQQVPVPVGHTNIFVQAGSFSSEANAQAMAQRLAAAGPARIYPATVNGRPFFRVRLGPFPQVEQADAALNRAVGAGANGAIIVVD